MRRPLVVISGLAICSASLAMTSGAGALGSPATPAALPYGATAPAPAPTLLGQNQLGEPNPTPTPGSRPGTGPCSGAVPCILSSASAAPTSVHVGPLPAAGRQSSSIATRGSHVRPKVVVGSKWTAPNTGGYTLTADGGIGVGDNGSGTTIIGLSHNGTSNMVFLFTSTSGSGIKSFGFCGFDGFTRCSDPEIVYDRLNNSWLISFAVYNDSGGGEIIVGGSPSGAGPLGGFNIYSIGKVSGTSLLDQPRLAYTTDKVLVTANLAHSGVCSGPDYCTRAYVIRKSDLECSCSVQQLHYDTWGFLNTTFEPISTPSYEGTTMITGPNPYIGNSNATWEYVQGAQGSETWTGQTVGIGSFHWQASNGAGQYYDPNNVVIDTDDSRINQAVYTNSQAWAVGNNSESSTNCSLGYCNMPYVMIFSVDSNGKPTGTNPLLHSFYLDKYLGNNLDAYYPGIATTITHSSVLGTMDLSSGTVPNWGPSSEGFQLDNGTGTYTYTAAGRQTSTVDVPYDGQTTVNGLQAHRWGDYNSCAYWPGTSPAKVSCEAEYAVNNSSDNYHAIEVYTNTYS